MFKKSLLCLILLPIFFLTTAWAEGTKIGVFDLQKVMQQSAKFQKIQKALEKRFSSRKEELVAEQQLLQADAEKLNRDAAVMTPDSKTKLQEKIVKGKRELQRKQEDFQREVSIEQNKKMQQFSAEVRSVIAKTAKKGGYDLIIQEPLPYVNKRVDITAQVIKDLS